MLVTAHCLPFHYKESSLQGFALQPDFRTYQKWQFLSLEFTHGLRRIFLPSEGAMLHSKCPVPGNRNRKQILYLDLLYSSSILLPSVQSWWLSLFAFLFHPDTKMEMSLSTYLKFYVFCCYFISSQTLFPVISSLPPLAPLFPRRNLFLIKKVYCFFFFNWLQQLIVTLAPFTKSLNSLQVRSVAITNRCTMKLMELNQALCLLLYL